MHPFLIEVTGEKTGENIVTLSYRGDSVDVLFMPDPSGPGADITELLQFLEDHEIKLTVFDHSELLQYVNACFTSDLDE